ELLEQYRQTYPYRINAERYDRMRADLLDSLGRPLEALIARRNADIAASWGIPNLDILVVSNDTIRFSSANAFIHTGQLLQAHEQFRTLLNLYPKSGFAPAALLGLAQINYSYGQSVIASEYLDTLEGRFPHSPSNSFAEHLRPELLMKTEKYSTARSVLTRLIENSDDQDSLFHYRMQRTVCLYRLNRLQEARTAARAFYNDFRDHTDLNSAKAVFHLEKGRSLEKSGHPKDARKEYRIVTRDYRTTEWVDDAAYFNGLSLVASGEADDGIAALERFIEDYPESQYVPDAYLSLGLTHYDAERYPEAVAALQRVCENDSTQLRTGSSGLWLTAFEVLAKVYRDLRFWDASIRLVRDYMELFPNAPDLLDRRMDIGQYYLQLGEWDEAIQYYRPLLSLADAEQEAEIQYYIGEAYFNSGDYRTAILEYLKVKILGRRTRLDWGVTALYQVGLCYEALEEWAGAARMYRQIIAERGGTSNYGRAAQRKLDALPEGGN
ncbi:MAG: tetratricopeptide repeat protein, partial [Candidatus Electryoneaceae bacterium]|nr:tetratricopeptide repeat protein [Candidatus Electryoneaceae bacterium]